MTATINGVSVDDENWAWFEFDYQEPAQEEEGEAAPPVTEQASEEEQPVFEEAVEERSDR